ncbi:hypothetical protein [Actinomadura sp. 9N407]|uniref:hypothetical protein n=1 Tax=Actinomadura sp. 9N407 TaxID=3375154 RepID=UPI003793BF25
MIRTTWARITGAMLILALTATGSEYAGTDAAPDAAPRGRIVLSSPGGDAKIRNPGTGAADPHLTAALLTDFQTPHAPGLISRPRVPGAGVRFPIRDRESLFMGIRQMGTGFDGGRLCLKWTGGMWLSLVTARGSLPGVELGLVMLTSPLPHDLTSEERARHVRWKSLIFSEALVSAPGHVLDALNGSHPPASCSRMTTDNGAPGRVEPLPAPGVPGSWAYRIIDTKGKVWHWGAVVRLPNHLIEIRIPNMEPGPGADMVTMLNEATAQAYAKATRVLG